MQTVQESLLAKILDSVPGGVVHVAGDGAIVIANDQAQAFLGLSYDALAERFVADWRGETLREDGSVCPVEEYPVSLCLTTGQRQPPTTIGVRQPTGDVRWAVFSAIPVDTPSGRGAVVTFVDITERKRADAERARLQRELETSARLASIGQLAAGVAHEINNPLTFIMLGLDSLCTIANELAGSNTVDAAPLQAMLSNAQDAREGARRVRDIVRDLMTFGGGRRDAQPAVVELGSIVDSALKMARHEITCRAQLRMETLASPLVAVEEGRMVQVLLNILLNAARAIEEGQIGQNEVLVRVRQEAAHAIVEVVDTGCGIEAEHLDRLFDPFFSTRAGTGGSGLGLSVSHSIVQAHGGRIDVQSQPGAGSTFAVRLPLATRDELLPRHRPDVERKAPAATRLRLLMVEDDALVRRALTNSLRGLYDLTVANSCAHAGRVLGDNQAFDVVLCDMTMPDGSGEDVHRLVRERAPTLLPRIIFMTGGVFTPRARRFIERTQNPVLHKPFELDELAAAVRRLNP